MRIEHFWGRVCASCRSGFADVKNRRRGHQASLTVNLLLPSPAVNETLSPLSEDTHFKTLLPPLLSQNSEPIHHWLPFRPSCAMKKLRSVKVLRSTSNFRVPLRKKFISSG